MSSQVNIV